MDNSFKRKLFDHESEPLPDSWAKISASLDSETQISPKKSFNYYYLAVAASVVIVCSIALLFWMKGQDSPQVAQTNSAIEPKAEVKNQMADSKLVVDTNNVSGQEETSTAPKVQEKKRELVMFRPPVFFSKETLAEKEEFLLPDSSKVYLNRNSRISYSSEFLKYRGVYLEEGEVFFEVKHRNGQPFEVIANLSKVEVLGTSFMVRSYRSDKKDEVFVNTGKVAFSSLQDSSDRVLLTKGLHAEIFAARQVESSLIKEVNYQAWREEKIVFNNTKLDEVSKTLEKYYAVSLQLKNPEILNCRFTGTFEKSGINEILKILAVSFNLLYDKQEGKYIISGKGCK